jgi:hypothetical protein
MTREPTARMLWLASAENPDSEVREAWKAKLARMADGTDIPTLPTRLKAAVGAVSRAVGAAIHGEPVFVSAEEADRRAAICAACEHWTGLKCKLCGCLTQPKTALATEQCPDNPPRWLRVTADP